MLCALPVGAEQNVVTRTEFEALKKEIEALRTEVEALRRTPPARPRLGQAPKTAQATISNAPSLGSKDARVVMVEYADSQCPFCHKFLSSVFPELKRLYIDTGKLLYVVKDLPLDFHPQATQAALANLCAGEQDQYWLMRELVMQHSQPFKSDVFLTFAARLSLDIERFQKCLAEPDKKTRIDRDKAEAAGQQITGTPTFIIGRNSGEGHISGQRIVGALPLATFIKEIDLVLASSMKDN